MTIIFSWGRVAAWEHHLKTLSDRRHIAEIINESMPGLAYGMGRSYGDVGLNPNGFLWQTAKLDRLISFDENTGQLSCEAGVLLRDIQRLMIPRCWILPVSPGTQLITVGGAIANDVHGKNQHHYGSFGNHIQKISLLRTDGEIIECGPQLRADWFSATLGGLGLTGFIVSAVIQLRRVVNPFLDIETIPYQNLSEFFSLADEADLNSEYAVLQR